MSNSDPSGVRKTTTVVIAVILNALFTSTSADLNTNIEGVIVPGITVEEIVDPSTIHYDKLVPVVLEFKTFPGLSPTSVLMGRSKILPRLACRSDDKPYSPMSTADWLFTCPMSYHMSNLLNQLYTNWTDIQPNSRATRNAFTTEFQSFSNSELSFEECESQLRYWRGINNRDSGMYELRVILEKCSLASYFEEQIPDFNYPVGPIYEQMRDNYVINFFGNVTTPGTTNGGDMVATLIALQSLMALNFYTEVTRWRETISSCQNNLIPNAIVKSTRLDRILQDIRSKITPLKYSTSVNSLTKFYKLPIADCIFGQNSLFVRILVPVKRDKTVYRSIRINQPRFLYNDELCQVTSSSKSDGAFPLTTSGYLIEKISHTLVVAGCDSGRYRRNGQLCKIPDKTNSPPPDKCLTSIVNENLDGIKSYCRLDCEKIFIPNLYSTSLVELPIIHRVESSKFIITLNQITSILIKCESAGLPDQMIPPQKFGAVEVTLPCECVMVFHADKYFPYEPCVSITVTGVSIHHALPIHMVNSSFESYVTSRLQSYSGKPRNYFGRRKITFANVSLYINMTFKDEDIVEIDLTDDDEGDEPITTVNGTTTILQASSGFIPGENDKSQGHGALWAMIIVQVIITLIILTYFILKIRSMEKRLDENRASICFSNARHSQLTLADKY